MSSLHLVQSDRKKRAYLVSIQLPRVSDQENQSSLDELSRLVETLGLKVVGRTSQKRSGTGSAFVLGEGKVHELAKLTGGPGIRSAGLAISAGGSELNAHEADSHEFDSPEAEGTDRGESEGDDSESYGSGENEFDLSEDRSVSPEVVIFDCELTPSQTRNLERALDCEVMDRTGVIIEIFSRHARTRAARLQVEIARLTYLAPRIRETGGGRDRGGGGIGGKGAGESAVELDRRKIRDRIKELRSEFATIAQEHDTRRARRSELRTVALVGYTNAGKSSLMRALTGSEVYVADKLFATLDTTVRPLHPPARPQILVSDTVGFIKKLPHDLIASFKSTLDEAAHAALLLFVVDASDPAFPAHLEITRSVLAEVGAADVASRLVLNKSDRLDEGQRELLINQFPDAVLVSTRSRESVERLRDFILEHFEGEMIDEDILVPYTVQGAIGEIRSRMRVIDESYHAEGVMLRVRALRADLDRLRSRFGL